jgi:hypothetical protein
VGLHPRPGYRPRTLTGRTGTTWRRSPDVHRYVDRVSEPDGDDGPRVSLGGFFSVTALIVTLMLARAGVRRLLTSRPTLPAA